MTSFAQGPHAYDAMVALMESAALWLLPESRERLKERMEDYALYTCYAADYRMRRLLVQRLMMHEHPQLKGGD